MTTGAAGSAEAVPETPASPPTPQYLTCAEVARVLQVSKMTVYRLMDTAALRSIRIGRSYRVAPADLKAYLEGAVVTPPSPCSHVYPDGVACTIPVADHHRVPGLAELHGLPT